MFSRNLVLSNLVRLPVAKIFLLLCTSALTTQSAIAQATTVTGVTIEQEAVTFKSANLRDRVTESVEHTKQNDLSYIYELMRVNRTTPDSVLSLLEAYRNDPDLMVRFGIVKAASLADTTKSFAILISLVTDAEVGQEAIRVLYDKYTCSQLVKKGGKRLEGALVRAFIRDRYSTYGTVLMSCMKGDSKVVALLERRRASYMVNAKGERDVTNECVTIDLTLAELGRKDALSRLRKAIEAKDIKTILVILTYIKPIQNKAVLLPLTELLKDKSNARRTGFADGPVIYTRLGDEVLQAFNAKFDNSAQPVYGPPKRFSDVELSQAYTRYMKLLSPK